MATARDAAASTDRIAATLEARREHHVNTAHHRLGRRIVERTGCDLRGLPDVIDRMTALRLTDRGGDA